MKRNTVIHGLWFAEENDDQSVARRQRGKAAYSREQFAVADVNELAQKIKNASYDFAEIGQGIAWPDWPGLGPRDGREIN